MSLPVGGVREIPVAIALPGGVDAAAAGETAAPPDGADAPVAGQIPSTAENASAGFPGSEAVPPVAIALVASGTALPAAQRWTMKATSRTSATNAGAGPTVPPPSAATGRSPQHTEPPAARTLDAADVTTRLPGPSASGARNHFRVKPVNVSHLSPSPAMPGRTKAGDSSIALAPGPSGAMNVAARALRGMTERNATMTLPLGAGEPTLPDLADISEPISDAILSLAAQSMRGGVELTTATPNPARAVIDPARFTTTAAPAGTTDAMFRRAPETVGTDLGTPEPTLGRNAADQILDGRTSALSGSTDVTASAAMNFSREVRASTPVAAAPERATPEAALASATNAPELRAVAGDTSVIFGRAPDVAVLGAASPGELGAANSGGTHANAGRNAETEKFAGRHDPRPETALSDGLQAEKNALAVDTELITKPTVAVGINTAEPESLMPALAHPTPSPFAENEPMSMSAVPLTYDTLMKESAEPQAELSSSARRAVDSAMATAQHFTNGSQRGVNLQFSVSGMDVAVRVEMRHDGVHTTFRTDSPELRAALAQEWNSVLATPSADRPQRLAEPVFTSASSGGPNSGDSGASQHRDSGTRQSQWETPSPFAPPASASAAIDAAVAAVAPELGAAPLIGARHLHTFA